MTKWYIVCELRLAYAISHSCQALAHSFVLLYHNQVALDIKNNKNKREREEKNEHIQNETKYISTKYALMKCWNWFKCYEISMQFHD